ncbi:MAG TPA: hypothetical protein VF246_00980 [Acidimicrobiia bacterium]
MSPVAAAARGSASVEGRVAVSHRIASAAFRIAGLFGVVAVVWAVVVLVRGGSWWGPLHSFLAGTVLFAIAGASQMFTITWAAAPPPPSAVSTAQRRIMAAGVALVLWGVASETLWAGGLGAVTVVVGLGLLAYSLVAAIRKSLLRRFDLATRFYLLAIGSGIVGVGLGGVMATDIAGTRFTDIRTAHARLNLVGLLGLTIAGTLPTILPTFVPSKAVSGKEAVAAWWAALVASLTMAAGALLGGVAAGIGVALAGVALGLILGGILFRLRGKGRKGGLPYFQVSIGVCWLVIWTLVDGVSLARGETAMPFTGWTAAAALVGVGQVLLGSFAYLIPVLAGPPPRLGRNLARTKGHPWLPLLAANAGGVALVVGAGEVAVASLALWLLDFGWRLARLEWRDRA